MARLREKIKELQTKYGISEEAAKDLLELHDGDLSEASAMIKAEQDKVTKWNTWYNENGPVIQASLEELEQLKAKMQSLEKAGFTINQPQTPTNANPGNQAGAFDVNALKNEIYSNFSAVQKDLYNIQREHLKNYKELPDLAPIEKLINEQKMTPWSAYQSWVGPMETERKEKELRDKITTELTAKFQNEATRSGVNGFLLTNKSSLTGEEVTSPLDEVVRERAEAAAKVTPKAGESTAPSDLELMADFVGSMRNGRQAAH